MKRCIFSLYIDMDKDRIENNSDYQKNILTKNEFISNYKFLVNSQKKYADNIKVDYFIFENDNQYKQYYSSFDSYMSDYNIINFYKIYLMYKLAEEYDEIVYLDLDVVPLTNESIFDLNFKENGIAVRVNHECHPSTYLDKFNAMDTIKDRENYYNDQTANNLPAYSPRSPEAKYWNCRAMLILNGYSGTNDVYNTGIVGAHKKDLKKLKYFNSFKKDIELMHELVNDEVMWPNYIKSMFGYDNETLFSYKMICNKIKRLDLDDIWHYPLRTWDYIPNETKMVHVINKKFDIAKEKYEELNL